MDVAYIFKYGKVTTISTSKVKIPHREIDDKETHVTNQ